VIGSFGYVCLISGSQANANAVAGKNEVENRVVRAAVVAGDTQVPMDCEVFGSLARLRR